MVNSKLARMGQNTRRGRKFVFERFDKEQLKEFAARKNIKVFTNADQIIFCFNDEPIVPLFSPEMKGGLKGSTVPSAARDSPTVDISQTENGPKDK